MKVVASEELREERGEVVIDLDPGTTFRLELLGLPPDAFMDYHIIMGMEPDVQTLPRELRHAVQVTNVTRQITQPVITIPLAARFGGDITVTAYDKDWVCVGRVGSARFRPDQSVVTIACADAIDFRNLRSVNIRLVFPESTAPRGRLRLELEDVYGSATVRKKFLRRSGDRFVDIAFSSVSPGRYIPVVSSDDALTTVLDEIMVGDRDISASYVLRASASITVRIHGDDNGDTPLAVQLWDARGVFLGSQAPSDASQYGVHTVHIERIPAGTYFIQAIGAEKVSLPVKVTVGDSEAVFVTSGLQKAGHVLVALDHEPDASNLALATVRNSQGDELRKLIRSRLGKIRLPAGFWEITLEGKTASITVDAGHVSRWDVPK